MNVEIRLAKVHERETLSNLLEKYNYEFSQYVQQDVDKNGLYGYPYLDDYWSESGRWAYFILADGNLAGFVLVNNHSELETHQTDFSVAEFFVMHKYRRKGVGKRAFYQVMERHQGSWQLKCHPGNVGASYFWSRMIDNYTKGSFDLIKGCQGTAFADGTLGDVFYFESKA